MKKQLLNLGIPLNRTEQRLINGGKEKCNVGNICGPGECCNTKGWCQPRLEYMQTGILCVTVDI